MLFKDLELKDQWNGAFHPTTPVVVDTVVRNLGAPISELQGRGISRMGIRRRVLFIAYNFPPHQGAGVQRSLKFVKYLPEMGWDPTVLTTLEGAAGALDRSLLADVPSTTRLHRVEGFSIRALRLRYSYPVWGKLVSSLNVLLQIPDPDIFWARKARACVEGIFSSEPPDLVYSTSGPASSHFLGMWTQSRFGIPWLADFRDPWAENLSMPYLPGYRVLNRRLERKVLSSADRVTCVSGPWLADLQRNLGKDPKKFLVIPNGYDESDVAPSPLPTRSDRFALMHIGSFYRKRRPQQVLAAVARLIGQRKIPADELEVLFVGKNAEAFVPNEGPVRASGYVPHRDLSSLRERADAFLLILDASPANRGNYSGKIYEYLAANRPLLAIVPPGGVAEELIRKCRAGISVRGEVGEIADGLERLFHCWKDGNREWNPRRETIERLTRRNATFQLVSAFESMLSRTNGP